VTEACFTGFGAAIEAFRRQLTVDEAALLSNLEAMSVAIERASAELAGQEYAEGTG
jgi:hypothetical protein